MPYLKKDPPSPEPLDCRIMTAALELFVSNGYHNVSIHEVQKRARVSIGSIYNHFGGKEGIARALYNHILNEIEELVDDTKIQHASPRKQCESIIRQLFEHTETHKDIIAYVFYAKHTEFLPDEPLICDAAPFTKMRDIIKQGMEQGEFQMTDPWVATSMVFGGAFRMIQLRLDGALDKPLPEYFDTVMKITWTGIKN
jgi:AcrR family transcriptional regulator